MAESERMNTENKTKKNGCSQVQQNEEEGEVKADLLFLRPGRLRGPTQPS